MRIIAEKISKTKKIGDAMDTAGWYPKKTWAKIDTALYFFKNTGYMAKNEYISGYWLGSKGSWTYRTKSSWNSDFRG